jgi:tripartite-type tricarboxylate transporter receptor subunit TctC
MDLNRRKLLHLCASAVLLPNSLRSAAAQSYPGHPITVIVPVPAGGQMDSVARVIVERMRVTLGQPLIVENITGASGTIGVGRVARADPDGYTLLYGAWATQVVNGAVYSLPYDAMRDFEPIALTSVAPWMIAARTSLPVNDLKELITWLKDNPDKALAGTSGAGGPGHIGGVLFQKLSGTSFQFIPYRGVTPAISDLVAGQIDIMIADPASAVPQFRAGRVKLFAVTSPTRSPAAPHLPTVDEAGLPGLYLAPWHGIWSPKATAPHIIARVNAAVVETLRDTKVRQRLNELGSEIPPPEQQTPEALRTFHQAEIDRWWPIIKAAGVKPG